VISVSLLVILGLASWLLATYQVDGPVYKEIVRSHTLRSDMQPAALTLNRYFLVLRGLLDARDAEELAQGADELQALEKEYRGRVNHWREKLPAGKLKDKIVEEAYKPADEICLTAN